MTKKELINNLKGIPDDAEVLVPSDKVLGYVSPVLAISYDGETNKITISGEDFTYRLEEEEENNG